MNRRMILNTIMLGMFIFLFAFKLFPRPWHQIAGVLVLTVFTCFLCSDYMTTSYGSTLPYNAHLISRLHKLFAKILLLLIAGHVFFHWKAFSSWIRHGLKI